jgi:RimJ/RimL family protein N-acetyltransferase
MAMLLESWQTQNYFPYTVELKLRDGEVYGSVSFEIPTPEVKYTKENGVIAANHQPTPLFGTFTKQQRPPRVDISLSDSRFSHSER